MTCDHLSRVWALCVMVCAAGAATVGHGAKDFDQKVSLLLKEEPENPKCFVENMSDMTCFWVEDEERAGSVDQYSFTSTIRDQGDRRCPLRAVSAAGGNKLFVCHLSQTPMFIQMFIQVHREEKLIHNRSLLTDQIFLLDPPTNLTVSSTGQRGQLSVSWVPPTLKYADDSMKYEVSYSAVDVDAAVDIDAAVDSHVVQVDETRASSELILRDLQPGTEYEVRVRVKMDGVSYNGYWSAWSDPVSTATRPAELDPVLISLTLIIFLILVVLSLTMLLSHRRFLKKKIWPTIPTPDNKFNGLFTVYSGDFKEWLRHTNGGLWVTPVFSYPEECPSPLEVLSELSLCPPLPTPPLPLSRLLMADRMMDPMKTSLERGESAGTDVCSAGPRDPWLMERLRALHQHHVPCSQSSLLESQDAYVSLSANDCGGHRNMDDNLEETLPLEVLFASRKTALCESHSDLGSMQQSSGSGRLSSQSSFEYPNSSWMPKGSGYAYMAVADSGVSMDYSPMSRGDDVGKALIYTNEYKNEIPAVRRAFLQRQHAVHDDG